MLLQPQGTSAPTSVKLKHVQGVGAAPPEAVEDLLRLRIEEACVKNMCWYLQQYARGNKPPCCSKCAKIKYVPTAEMEIVAIPELVVANKWPPKRWACGPATAMAIGAERVKLIRKGASWDEACAAYFAEIEARGDGEYHALMVTPEGIVDATEKMERG